MKILSVTNLCLGHTATLPERMLFRGLASKGADLTVVTHYPTAESKDLEDNGIRVLYIPIEKKIDLNAVAELKKLLKSERFDILHMTYSKGITNGIIAARNTETKLVGYIGALSVHWHDPFAYMSFLNRRLDAMICLSNGVEEHMITQSMGRLKGKTKRIYKGYDPLWVENTIPISRSEIGASDDDFLICCVANVRRIKGIPYLIKAAGLLPPGFKIRFLLVGPGMDSPGIRKLIKRTAYRDRFITLGFSSEVLRYTAACDLYVQPSLTEGLGRSVIEAMCLSKPVLASGRGGVGELIEEGVNGYFVKEGSAEAIAEKILLCYNSRDRMGEMGLKSRNRIVTHFNPGNMIDQTLELFETVASGKSIKK
jgi:glycosyltransferase involved in cell wall biosynthesis